MKNIQLYAIVALVCILISVLFFDNREQKRLRSTLDRYYNENQVLYTELLGYRDRYYNVFTQNESCKRELDKQNNLIEQYKNSLEKAQNSLNTKKEKIVTKYVDRQLNIDDNKTELENAKDLVKQWLSER